MAKIIVGPVLHHLQAIGLDQGNVTLATAFYSRRALSALRVQARTLTLMCRLDLMSADEWAAGYVAPDALLDFVDAQMSAEVRVSLYVSAHAHAKVYLGNAAALIGSANLTMRGFGGGLEVVTRLEGASRLTAVRRALSDYRKGLTPLDVEELRTYVYRHHRRVKRLQKGRTGTDRLPDVQRSTQSHLGSYEDFLGWLTRQPSYGASEIAARAAGKGNLSGHIHRNFHGLRQLLLAYPELTIQMSETDTDTYKLSRDASVESAIRRFVHQNACDEPGFSLDTWRTYLPVECGGRAGRHGGTIGNLNYMLPLVARYLRHKLGRT